MFGVKTMQSRRETVWSATVSPETNMSTMNMLVSLTVFGFVDVEAAEMMEMEIMGLQKADTNLQQAIADLDDQIEKQLVAEIEAPIAMDEVIIEGENKPDTKKDDETEEDDGDDDPNPPAPVTPAPADADVVCEAKAEEAIVNADPMVNFKPNADQQNLINKLIGAIKGRKTSTFVVQGRAGTGKTTCIYYALQMAKDMGIKFEAGFSATSWKAASRLQMCIAALGGNFSVLSVDSMFGMRLTDNLRGPQRGYTPDEDRKIAADSYNVHIIDESSMLDERKYDAVMNAHGIKIFLGDMYQAPPIKNENGEPSISLVDPDVTLSIVERQKGDNPIPNMADDIIGMINENSNKTIKFSTRMGKDGGITVINRNDVAKCAVKNNCHILSYTNNGVVHYNNAVREMKGFKKQLEVGDMLMGYVNLKSSTDTSQEKFTIINGVEYKVLTVGEITTAPNGIEYIPFTAVDEFNREISSRLVTTNYMYTFSRRLALLRDEILNLENAGMRDAATDRRVKYAEIVGDYLFMEDILFDTNGAKQEASIKYGYACTIHKAQGCTWDNVILDHSTIPAKRACGRAYLCLMNVAITRSRHTTFVCQ
jgi:hypothetical protein